MSGKGGDARRQGALDRHGRPASMPPPSNYYFGNKETLIGLALEQALPRSLYQQLAPMF
jgi:hypothetical protein